MAQKTMRSYLACLLRNHTVLGLSPKRQFTSTKCSNLYQRKEEIALHERMCRKWWSNAGHLAFEVDTLLIELLHPT